MEIIEEVKLTFATDDGKTLVRALRGKDAQEWSRRTNGVCALAAVHGWNPKWEDLPWQEEVVEDGLHE